MHVSAFTETGLAWKNSLLVATAVSKENKAKVHLSTVFQKRLPVAMQYR